jgi:hypothetical protein
MSIKDIVDSSGTSIDYNKVMSQLSSVITNVYGSSSIDVNIFLYNIINETSIKN